MSIRTIQTESTAKRRKIKIGRSTKTITNGRSRFYLDGHKVVMYQNGGHSTRFHIADSTACELASMLILRLINSGFIQDNDEKIVESLENAGIQYAKKYRHLCNFDGVEVGEK